MIFALVKGLCEKARMNIASADLNNEVRIDCNGSLISSFPIIWLQAEVIHDNVMNVDFSDGTAFFVYLVPEGILAIRDGLIQARIFTFFGALPLHKILSYSHCGEQALGRNAQIVTYGNLTQIYDAS